MSDNTDALSRGYEAALCNYLQAAGGTAVGALAYSAIGGPAVSVPVAVAVAGISAMAYAHGCSWDPDAPGNLPGSGDEAIKPGQCMETVGCDLMLTRGAQGGASYTGPVRKLLSSVRSGTYPNGTPKCTTTWIDCDGIEQSDDEAIESLWPIGTYVRDGGECVGDPSPEPGPNPTDYVYEYTDEITNCTNNFSLQGFVTTPDGQWNPVFDVSEAGTDPGVRNTATKPTVGCSFNNIVIYKKPTSGGGDPPIIIPPGGGGGGGGDDEVPWWLGPLTDFLPYLAYNTLMELAAAIAENYPEETWELVSPCDKDDEGQPDRAYFPIPGGGFQRTVMDKLDALQANQQVALSWKTPICTPEPTPLEGDFRTISFRSDETSPYGKSRLRKRLRYRSLSGIGLGELVDHWKDFTFEGGPYRVRWTGGSWGTVEVWAASEDEGKRVIQHAAAEAGAYALETGGWSTRVSSSTRLGVPGTMRVDTTGGYYWITERDGSDGRPLVAR